MARTSRIYDLLAALVDALTTAVSDVPGAAGPPPVTIGMAADAAQSSREAVYVVAQPVEADQQWSALGPATREENLRVTIEVYAFEEAETAALALARLRELTDAIETQLRPANATPAQITLGVAGINWVGVGGVVPDITPVAEGWIASASIPVAANARLS